MPMHMLQPRVAPLETGGGENFVEAFFFGLGLDAAPSQERPGLLDAAGYVLAGDELGGGAKIVDAGIGCRSR